MDTLRRAARSLKQLTKNLPGVQRLRRWRYEQYFAGPGYARYRGVFRSFDAARASAPAGKALGFDVEEFLGHYADRSARVFPYDYPMLFWLKAILTTGTIVFDWGGHLGVHYYSYSKYLTYPSTLQWIVCEVPRIAAAGDAESRRRGETALRFSTAPRSADGANILIAAGSLQYVENPTLPALLASLAHPPEHLLLNKLPLYHGNDFVTLQNAGVSFVPLHVWNRTSFIGSLGALGYELIDEWSVPERPLQLPLDPDRSFEQFTGLYLRKRT